MHVLRYLLLAVSTLCLLAWIWWAALPVVDDAAISISYGLTFWEGYGLRLTHFSPRVEGFTSLLWALWCGLGARLGADPLRFAHWSGPCFAAVGAWLLSRGPFNVRAPAGALALLACAAFPSVGFWLSSGMETGLQIVALALALTVALSASRPAVVGTVLASLILVRPEYLVLGAALLGVWALPFLKVRHARPVLLAVSVWAGVLALVFVARLAYFADWLPNTYYIKRNWDFHGPAYVGAFATRHLPLIISFVLGIVGLALAGWWRHALGLLLVVCAGLQFGAYRGDWMREWRFLVPLVPFLALPSLLAWSAANTRPAGKRRLAARVCAAAAVGLVVAGAVAQRSRHLELKHAQEFPATFVMDNARRWRAQLDALGVKRPLIGLPDIGGVGLVFREADVMDVAGLADYSIGHATSFPVMEDYIVNEGPPLLVDAHGPSGHVASFKGLQAFIPGWRGGVAMVPLTAEDDRRCPGLKQQILTAPERVAQQVESALLEHRPIDALRMWRCLTTYAAELPSAETRAHLAERARALADDARTDQPELALRFLSLAAVVGDDPWTRRHAEQLRLKLSGTP